MDKDINKQEITETSEKHARPDGRPRHARQDESAQHEKHGQSDQQEKHGQGSGHAKPVKKKHRFLKAMLLIILLLLVAIAGTVYYLYKTAEDSLAVVFTEESPSVEFGGEYSAMDFVKSNEGKVTPEAEMLDAESTGEKQLTYTVTKPVLNGILNPSKEFTLTYTVTDSVPPLMIWSGDGAVLERGTKFDINDVIAYGDNADPVPKVEVKGKVDMEVNGSYPLHVTVSDASGNKTEWDLTVEVADQVPPYENNAPRTDFGDFVSAYAGEGRVFGIDVSAWQDEIDFDAVKAAGCEFVMIRIGYGSGSDSEIDKQFYSNLKGAKEAGLKVGVYFYSYDSMEEEARASAAWIAEKLEGEELDLPVAFDWEDFSSFQTYGMSFADLNGLYDAFADELSKSGYDCMLYGSKVYLEKVWEDTDVRPVWLAHYTEKTDYKGPFAIWQASCTGRIDGIDGDVDLDILYVD